MPKRIKKLTKHAWIRFILSCIMVISSSLLQVYTIQVFMTPCNLLSSGFTGVSILINKIGTLIGMDLSVSMMILVLNIPAAILCYKSVSKRFVFLSCLQFGLTSFFLQILTFHSVFDDLILNVLFGGVLYGSSVVLALKADGSTGGTDFIALYISDKLHKSIWDYVFLFNACMLVIFGALFGWEAAGYSIIFQFISTRTISSFHHRYAQITVEITTDDPEAVTEAFVSNFRHGMSVVDAYGAYSKKHFYICKAVVSSYEEADVVDCIRSIKPNVIINSYKTNHFYGNFYHKPIE